jgi:hypothetical protein
MAYTPDKPKPAESSDQLRARIPGWGADLDPKDRPSVPREQYDPTFSGAHWEFPERQPEKWPRERSIEHKFLTPVFGTAQPLKGLSGIIRRYAYTFSEGQTAHWLLLLAGDRVDVVESRLAAMAAGRPDNPITESGVLRELKGGAFRTRFGQHRADLKHQPIDILMWAAPYVAIGVGVYLAGRALSARRAAA